ncbi:MAG TPA: helix-hairpin-helix domain-containing protein [Pyrinomonadaceae bacterium]|nr:helix-hairpin-helix domain-containing protein [Pyrinomonadaceae bacterium]
MRAILRSILLSSLVFAFTTACVKLPRRASLRGEKSRATHHSAPPVSINRASREELERLPGVGPTIAARIVEHRERHGPFRKAEHLLVVPGISERRFREIRALVTAE